MSEVVKLVHEGQRPVRACSTCRHLVKYRPTGNLYDNCGATGFAIKVERDSDGPCGQAGMLWEPVPEPPKPEPWPGIFVVAWRFLFGRRTR